MIRKMTAVVPPLFFSFMLLMICHTSGYAQDSSGTQQKFENLLDHHQQNQLDDTTYLKLADSLAGLTYNNDSLEQWLIPYQQIAFSKKELGLYRINYYNHLRKLSDNKNRYGSAIYYSEKRNEEKLSQGLIIHGEIPNSALYAMAVHFGNKDYKKVFASYEAIRPLIIAMPAHIVSGNQAAHPESVSIAFAILDVVGTAAWKTRDTALLDEMILQGYKMIPGVERQAEKYQEFIVYCRYINHCLAFYKAILLKQDIQVRSLLATCLSEVKLESFGEINYPLEYACDKYMEAFDYYYDLKLYDSAQKYLGLVHSLISTEEEFSNERLSFWLEGNSRLQASVGNLDSAFLSLQQAFNKMSDAYYSVNTDKDNNLYAMAKAENAHKELLLAEAQQRKAEQFNLLLFTLIGVLVSVGVAIFLAYQSRQKQKLHNLQLNLARNFHDELGPMLLYTNLLLKKESDTNPSPGLAEAKGQVGQIIESIRSISQDLKTNQFKTVTLFEEEIITLLKKIKNATEIDYAITLSGSTQILTNLHYDNLRKVVNELITNSVKHSDCSLITVKIAERDMKIKITYADNGKGFAPGYDDRATADDMESNTAGQYVSTGIGLQNISERMSFLKGEFVVNNFYPDGYWVEMVVPIVVR